jgi:RNA polymerase sigma factor (sigma-70 family)
MRGGGHGVRAGADAPPAKEAGDAALVAAAQLNPAGYAALYGRYWEAVFRYCYYRLADWQEAEDAASQVFVDAFARLGAFRDRGDSFRPWLFTIAHNEVVGRYRRQGRRLFAPLAAAFRLVDPAPSPEERAIAADEHGRALALLAQLPEDQRRVCELRLAGLTGKEVAAVLGKSHDAVRAAQWRAETRLRTLLGVGSTRREATDA